MDNKFNEVYSSILKESTTNATILLKSLVFEKLPKCIACMHLWCDYEWSMHKCCDYEWPMHKCYEPKEPVSLCVTIEVILASFINLKLLSGNPQ